MADEKDFLAPYKFLGLDFSTNGSGQPCADECPFCGKENHFHVNPENGKWNCKRCGEDGNIPTFLYKLYSLRLSTTTLANRKHLEKLRGIPAEAFARFKLATSGNQTWFPYFGDSGKSLLTIRVHDPDASNTIYNTEGTKSGLFNADALRKLTSVERGLQPIYICEGEWDTIALDWLLRKLKLAGVVVGVPGAAMFSESWVEWFKGCAVTLCYDHDEAGLKGTKKAIDRLSDIPSSVSTLEWPDSLPEGYDLNDFIQEHRSTPRKAWTELLALIKPVSTTPIEASDDNPAPKLTWKGPAPNFLQLCKLFRKDFYLSPTMSDGWAIVLATLFASRLPDLPLWVFLVGPSSSGKTLILRSGELVESLCHFESVLVPTTLVSGWDAHGDDPSLLPRIIGRTLLIKDYTTVKSLPATLQEGVYGVLRDAYDGKVDRSFANLQHRHYPDPASDRKNCHFGIVAGVTQVIHGDARASLGERFIKCEFIDTQTHDSTTHIRKALTNHAQCVAAEERIREATGAFIVARLPRTEKLPAPPAWVVDRIIYLTQVVAYLRAASEYPSHGDPTFRPRVEIGTRLGKQLLKLAQALCIVLDKRTIDKEIYRLIEKVALDTGYGWATYVLRIVLASPVSVSLRTIRDEGRLTKTTCERIVGVLFELGALERHRPPNPEKQGQPEYVYQVSRHFRSLWQGAHLPIPPAKDSRRRGKTPQAKNGQGPTPRERQAQEAPSQPRKTRIRRRKAGRRH